jgi:glycosyltransferase involved in cell wall biosynthesis
LRICILSPLYDPWVWGGAERYAKAIAEELSQEHEVIVITSKGPKEREKFQYNKNLSLIEINPLNFSTHYDASHEDLVDVKASKILLKKIIWHIIEFWNISAYLQLKKILTQVKPDIIHSNGVKPFSLFLFPLVKKLGIPHVHTIHDYELISIWSGLYRNRKIISKFNLLDKIYIDHMRRISQSIDAVISPSRFTLEIHEKLGFFKKSSKFVVPNGNIKPIKKEIQKLHLSNEFLLLGRIVENKGYEEVIKSFMKISNENVKLHIAGDGPYLSYLKEISEGDNRIIFYKYVSDEVLDNILEKCSYLIVPSKWYETFGLVIIEGLNRGLPVIASRIGGIPEIIKDGYNGFLFSPGNTDELKSIIEKIIGNEILFHELSKNAIESSKRFSIKNQLSETLKVYRTLLVKHND